MKDPIKPCPFCGQDGAVIICSEHGYFVECDDAEDRCTAKPRSWETGDDIEEAIRLWNTRAREEDLEAQRDNLFNENKALYRRLVAMQKQLNGKDAKKPRH